MNPYSFCRCWIFWLLLFLIGFSRINAEAQATPAYWDLLDVKTGKKVSKLYEIDFYRSPSTIFGHVDSVKFIELAGTSKPKSSVKWPIASYNLNLEEVRSQLGAELRIFDPSLAAVTDSTLWAAWARKDYNPLLEARYNLLVAIDTARKNTSKLMDTALGRSVKLLGARVNNLSDSLKIIYGGLDSQKQVKTNGDAVPISGANATATPVMPGSGVPSNTPKPRTVVPAVAPIPDTVHITVSDSSAYKAILAKYDSVIAKMKKKQTRWIMIRQTIT